MTHDIYQNLSGPSIADLVGQEAPLFSGDAIDPDGKQVNFDLSNILKKKKSALLVFYPLAFTMVCPTELIALNNRVSEFIELDVEIIAISVDSVYALQNWNNAKRDDAGLGGVSYYLFSDLKKEVSLSYGVLNKKKGVALRASFWITPNGIIESSECNNLDFGRDFDVARNKFEAFKYRESSGNMCPANWKKGMTGFNSEEGVRDYLTSNHSDL